MGDIGIGPLSFLNFFLAKKAVIGVVGSIIVSRPCILRVAGSIPASRSSSGNAFIGKYLDVRVGDSPEFRGFELVSSEPEPAPPEPDLSPSKPDLSPPEPDLFPPLSALLFDESNSDSLSSEILDNSEAGN